MIRHKNIWPGEPVMMQLPEICEGFMNLRLVEPSAAIFGAIRQEDQRGYPLRFEDPHDGRFLCGSSIKQHSNAKLLELQAG
jgi:hypothetical protein